VLGGGISVTEIKAEKKKSILGLLCSHSNDKRGRITFKD